MSANDLLLAEPENDRPKRAPLAGLDKALGAVLLLAVLCHPTQLTVRQWADLAAAGLGFGHRLARLIPRQNVTVSDCLLLVAFLLWMVRAVAGRTAAGRLRRYPLALVALFVCAGLSALAFLKPSAVGKPSIAAAARQMIQLGTWFICAYAVLSDWLRARSARRLFLVGFLVAGAAGVAAGLGEYMRLRPGAGTDAPARAIISPVEVDGSFGLREGLAPDEKGMIATASNRNVLGSWASVTVPLAWGVALWAPAWPLAAACGLLAAGGMLLLLQGGLWLATMLALLVISFMRGRVAFLGTAAGLALFWTAVFLCAPQRHGMVLVDSLMLRKGYDRFYTLRLYDDSTASPRPAMPADLDGSADVGRWQQKYAEWQPGLQAVACSPLFGVGLGGYQQEINRYYDWYEDPVYNPARCYRMTKPRVNLMEFGANSFYLVWLTSTGLVGLFGLIWVLMFGFARADGARRACAPGVDRGLAMGALGAMVALAGGMFFAEYLVRGVGVAVVFIFALAAALDESARPAHWEAENV